MVGLILLIGLQLVNWETGLAAAISYLVLAINPALMGLAAHATHFVVLFVLAGLLLLLRATSSSSFSSIFVSGLFLGVAVLMKQPGIIFLTLGFFWLLYREQNNRCLAFYLSQRSRSRSSAVQPGNRPAQSRAVKSSNYSIREDD